MLLTSYISIMQAKPDYKNPGHLYYKKFNMKNNTLMYNLSNANLGNPNFVSCTFKFTVLNKL